MMTFSLLSMTVFMLFVLLASFLCFHDHVREASRQLSIWRMAGGLSRIGYALAVILLWIPCRIEAVIVHAIGLLRRVKAAIRYTPRRALQVRVR